MNFAVFNVADASISVGVVVLLLGVWLHDKREARQKADQPSSEMNLPDTEENPDVGEQ
jgi:signal peptidase II